MEVSSIVSAFGALKTAKDIAESMVALHDAATFKAKLLEFQSKLIDANSSVFAAQDERAALLERVRDLEKQVANFKAWEAEKQRYALKTVSHRGSTAYVLKPEAQGTDVPHCICAACYEQGNKGILQPTQTYTNGDRYWGCSICKTQIPVTRPLPGYSQ